MASIIKLAAVLMLACSSSSQWFVGASCSNCLLPGQVRSNYAILAEHLHGATRATELGDNIKAAGSPLDRHLQADGDLVLLVNAFRSLKIEPSSEWNGLCGKENLANMRRLAEAMHADGNLGPKAITEPIRALNRLLIKYIASAQPKCPRHLESQWPKPWLPSFSDKDMALYVDQLRHMPMEFSYGKHRAVRVRGDLDHHQQQQRWARKLSHAIAESAQEDLWAHKRKLEPNCREPATTRDKSVLALQLRAYVYEPCAEYVALEEANSVLVPYSNLLASWHLADEQNMSEYFRDQDEVRRRPSGARPRLSDYDPNFKDLVLAHAACQRLLAMPEKEILHQVVKARLEGFH